MPTGVTYANASARELLARNGIADLDAALRAGGDACRHDGRRVCEVSAVDANGAPLRLFIKSNWGRRRWWPRMTDLKSGQAFVNLPTREWRGLHLFRSLGLQVPEPLALFREERLLSFRAAIVMTAIPRIPSIYEMLCDGRWFAIPQDARLSLTDEIVALVARLHAAGLGWRGISTGHIYPERTPSGGWSLWFIDCEGAHRWATRGTLHRDCRKIAKCFTRAGTDEPTLAHLREKIDRCLASAGAQPLDYERLTESRRRAA